MKNDIYFFKYVYDFYKIFTSDKSSSLIKKKLPHTNSYLIYLITLPLIYSLLKEI